MYDTMMYTKWCWTCCNSSCYSFKCLIINLPNEEDIQDKNDLIEAINPIITHKDGTQFLQKVV